MTKRELVLTGRLACILYTVLVMSAVAFGQAGLPTGEPGNVEFRFAVLGDSGNGNGGQSAIANRMLAVQRQTGFSLIFFLGDNVYNSGSPGDFGRKFALPYRQFIENGTELRAVLGNHDVRGSAEGGVLLQQLIFGMGPRPYYSFGRGGGLVEFFALDSNAFLTPQLTQAARDQLQWLDSALSRSKARWKIALLHHALYSSARKHGWNSRDRDEMESVRSAVEPLLVKHGVRLVLAAHDHVYERLKPQRGIRHFTTGVGSEARVGDLRTDSPFYEFGSDRELSFMLFSVNSESMNFWAITAQGSVIDSGAIR